ncbi:EamA family transporter [Sinorhizobium mexicanum]|uniref:EamA family transporter n=1 Tax=Sinorhizobium mexicanum TaxID=375549 RepID=A0A859R0V8_9HYPH|nr:EamA family transporter [Sinorhizobium mexicanum]
MNCCTSAAIQSLKAQTFRLSRFPSGRRATYLGLIVTVAGRFLWLSILRDVPAPIAASVRYLQPVFGIAASAVMFGDRIGIQFMMGVALILAMRTRSSKGLSLTATT